MCKINFLRVSKSFIKTKEDEYLFRNKNKRNNGTVDVWWLFEDGGLFYTVLMHLYV